MSAAQRAYRMLLHAYPAEFRARYGGEMTLLFRDQLNARRTSDASSAGAHARFWVSMVADIVRSAPALRLEAARTRWRAALGRSTDGESHIQMTGDDMTGKRAVAVLAIMGGTFEIVNAGVDVFGQPVLPRGGGWMLAIALAVLMGVMLAVAGASLLRGGADQLRWTRRVAILCLVLVVSIQLLYPFMSIFSRLLGVVIPIALLLAARRPSGPSMPSMA